MAATVVATGRGTKTRPIVTTDTDFVDLASVLPPSNKRKLDTELGLLLHGYGNRLFQIRQNEKKTASN